ncbi:hypothetical protein COT97_02085 [Candidatus Falkowbacteria bacterium CG10_big_fil_rev_8_21_14_0_10_39_11]|uniref:IPT/TIG domain-containing protein n=1 Tax=Candidatus Falkowbacteria bacterium CG10_big_fil_rev_8_21_14_0_10_39_11 TaxID=1974565 RepID=A0A2H0V775_9BACT|nr:MAG: hypothetical protein COT97_02085 [Candidatus Falkowbacteria bacterium CG10_big_fil_rev_8_21_14_0_10_39_11]
MKHKNKIIGVLIVLFIVMGGLFVLPELLHAQQSNDVGVGLEAVGSATVLGNEDPRIIIGRILRIFLGFLGVVSLAIVLYGGFLYMTSGGAETSVEKAKKWIINGIIGMVIIMSAFSITSYVINRLSEATGVVSTTEGGGGGGGDGGGGGGGVTGFSVGIAPRGANTPVNAVVQVTFPNGRTPLPTNEYQNAKDNIKVYEVVKDGDVESEVEVVGSYDLSDRKVTFVSNGECPVGCEATSCFQGEKTYRIKVLELQDQNGSVVACPNRLQGYCRQVEFTTTNSCDLLAPTVSVIPSPQQVRVGAQEDFPITAADASGLASLQLCPTAQTGQGVLCQQVVFEDENPLSYSSVLNASTIGFDLGWHTGTVKVSDVSNNESTAAGRYLVASNSCFNDGGEFDCSLPECEVDNCSECTGDDCTYTCTPSNCSTVDGVEQCSSVCSLWPYPLITNVVPAESPTSGFITIYGKNFGVFAQEAKVLINGVEAAPVCGRDSWSDRQVVVSVPNVATGPIQIFNNRGNWHNTADPNAPGWKNDLVITESGNNRIALCSVVNEETRENNGAPGDRLLLTGRHFGADGSIYFNGDALLTGIWSDDVIREVQVPFISSGNKTVQVGRDDFYSNPVNFVVGESDSSIVIQSVLPQTAPKGQIITIKGSNFGASGTVTFIRDNVRTPALTSCANNWSNTSIQVTIPDLVTGSYDLEIANSEGSVSVPYSVDNNLALTPGICSITPDNGPPGTSITIQGVGFGNTPGKVKFASAAPGVPSIVEGFNLQSAEWTSTQISGVSVPPDARSGELVIEQGGIDSNPVQFNVGRCTVDSCGSGEVCCQNSYCSAAELCEAQATTCEYGWYFSTGNIPKIPKVINRECSLGGFDESPSPRNNTQTACPNGLASFTFNMEMDSESFIDGDRVEIRRCSESGSECNLQLCDSSNCLTTDYNFVATGRDASGRILLNEVLTSTYDNNVVTQVNLLNYDLVPNTWYRVIVKAGVRNAPDPGDDVQELLNDYVWNFKTAATDCTIDSVVVNPSEGVLNSVVDQEKYMVSGQANNCGIIDVSDENWNWLVARYGDRINRLFVSGSRKDTAYFVVNPDAEVIETPPGDDGEIQVSGLVGAQSFQDEARLSISLADPKVIDYWPDCEGACVNAELGAMFNSYIPADYLKNNPGSVGLYECESRDCLSIAGKENKLANFQPGEIDCDSTTGVSMVADYGEVCNRLRIYPNPVLDPAKYYRLVIRGDVTNVSAKELTSLNFNTRSQIGTCGNGVIESDAGEQCEAICLNEKTNETCISGEDNCVCSLANNKFCSNDCRLVGFTACKDGVTGCCGDGNLDTYLGSAQLQEQCEVESCSKAGKVDFVGSVGVSALEVCNDYFNDNKNKPNILSSSCQCGEPRECDSPQCASYCLEDVTQKCTADSLDCTCVEPKVCQENTTEYCTDNNAGCDCQPQRSCEEDPQKSCTESGPDCTCRESGKFQFVPDVTCFDADPDKGECIKLTYCAGTETQCKESAPACTCVPLASTGAECPSEKDLVCKDVCSLVERQSCEYGDDGCSCTFPDNCQSCVLTDRNVNSASTFDSFSFVFKTREDGGFCRPDRVTVSPGEYLSTVAGEQILYSAVPYSEPDLCSSGGQRLSARQYDWDWEETTGEVQYYTDVNSQNFVGVDARAERDNKLIAMLKTLYSPQRAVSCTSNCLSEGSVRYQAVCGNNVVESGEECDGGAACTDQCLRAGTEICFAGNEIACCGNKIVDPGEDCDDGNGNNQDGCSKQCLNEGSNSAGFECGNGKVELGEDDDFGSAAINRQFGLDNNCLYKGSSEYIGSICGNGQVENGEECEPVAVNCRVPVRAADGSLQRNSDGNISFASCQPGDQNCVCQSYEDQFCSNKCVLKNFDGCNEDNQENCCGNGQLETYNNYTEECEAVCTDNEGQVCEFGTDSCVCRIPDWCTNGCLNGGSNVANAAFCANGQVEPGEDPVCELDQSGGGFESYGAPYSLVTVLGYLPDGATRQTVNIRGTLENTVSYLEESGDVGESLSEDSLLTYVYSGLGGPPPPSCDPNNPARAELISPSLIDMTSEDGSQTCPNAVIVVQYDLLMEQLHEPGVNLNQLIELRYQADSCGSAPVQVGMKIWNYLNKLFGRDARAAEWCLEESDNYSITSRVLDVGGRNVSQIEITTNDVLKVAHYEIRLKNIENNCQLLIPDQNFRFNVGSDYCHFDSVGISPAMKQVSERDEVWEVAHLAKSGNTIIQPFAGRYDWDWSSWESGDRDIVDITELPGSWDAAMANNKNGNTEISAEAAIIDDDYFGEIGATLVGSGQVSAYVCENPWRVPADSASIGWDDGNDGRNIHLRYCRDNGQVNNKMDDLPLLRVVESQLGADVDTLQKQYLMIRSDDIVNEVNTNDFVDDVISLRIYDNPDNLSVREWYKNQVPQAGQSSSDLNVYCGLDTKFGQEVCYKGIKDGNTVYISAGNLTGGEMRNYIFVLGYNLGANSRTIDMFAQMIDSMMFNINVTDSDVQFAIRRDIQRINDITDIKRSLQAYYDRYTTLPTVESGSYIRNVASSTWPSWQSTLANDLGTRLPVDPINKIARYEPSSNSSFTGEACGDNGKKCLIPAHQCFEDNGNQLCSVCARGSDPNTCYNSDSLIVDIQIPTSSPIDLYSYLYDYLNRDFKRSRISYRTEAETFNYYSIRNKPSTDFEIQ